MSLLNPERNPFFGCAEMAGFIATRRGRPVGRVAAVVNSRHNEFHGDEVGFFGYFECEDDETLAHALLDRVADWLRERRRTTMRGPVSPSTNDECGLLIDAFDQRPVFMMPYNPPYYADLLEAYGLRKARDLHAYEMTRDDTIADKVMRVARIAERRTGARLRPMDLARVGAELQHVKRLYAGAWEKNWGFVPLTDAELDFAAADMKQAIAPDGAFFAEIDGEPVGFALALLDLNQIFKDVRNGRLFPLGLWRILRGKSKVDRIRVLLLGMLPEYRGRGIDAMLYAALWGAERYSGGEFSWVLEDNLAMRDILEKMGARRYKTYRIYDLPLTDDASTESVRSSQPSNMFPSSAPGLREG